MTKYEKNPEIRTIRAKIQTFLEYVDGTFNLRDIYEALGAKSTEDKAAIRKGLSREKGETVESTGSYGGWRKIDRALEWIDLSAIGDDAQKALDLILPLGMGNLMDIYPGDLIIVAGRTNCGKSSFALELAFKNRTLMPVNYLSSEVTGVQVLERIKIYGLEKKYLQGINFAMRYENYQDNREIG